jgi:hypothetical protein
VAFVSLKKQAAQYAPPVQRILDQRTMTASIDPFVPFGPMKTSFNS